MIALYALIAFYTLCGGWLGKYLLFDCVEPVARAPRAPRIARPELEYSLTDNYVGPI